MFSESCDVKPFTVVRYVVRLLCFLVVVGAIYVTVDRYFTHETTANLSTMPTSEAPAFVAFTACTMRDQAYKDDALEKYGLTRKGVQKGNYSAIASIPKSPREVFDDITFSLDEIMLSVDIEFTDSEAHSPMKVPIAIVAETGNHSGGIGWRTKYSSDYGRCYSLEIEQEVITKWISKMSFKSKRPVLYLMHHPGQFMELDTTSRLVGSIGEKTGITLNFDISHDTLEGGSPWVPCSSATNLDFDDCLYNETTKALLQEFGCSPPYLPTMASTTSMNKVCDEKLSAEVYKRYDSLITEEQHKICTKPCATMHFFTGMPQNWYGYRDENVSYVDLEVRRYTKVRRIVWNYTLTNLYAEIGSYVGLFLGVAIVHCVGLIDALHSWIVDTSAVQVTK